MKKITILVLIAISVSCNRHREPLKTGLEGSLLPSFDLLLTDSVTHFNTNQIPSDHPIVFIYFSPQCPYCRAEMRAIIAGINKLKGIRIYAITSSTFQELKAFYYHYEMDKHPNIVVGSDYSNYFAAHFGATSIPYTVFFKKDRRLSKVFMGTMTDFEIKEEATN